MRQSRGFQGIAPHGSVGLEGHIASKRFIEMELRHKCVTADPCGAACDGGGCVAQRSQRARRAKAEAERVYLGIIWEPMRQMRRFRV